MKKFLIILALLLSANVSMAQTPLWGGKTAAQGNTFLSPYTGTWNGAAIAIGYGGTGQATANAGFNALAPLTTAGDIIIENASPIAARLAIGTANQVLGVSSSLPSWTTLAGDGTTITGNGVGTGFGLILTAANTWTGAITENQAGIAVTRTTGIVIENTTASTTGTKVQGSPNLRLLAHDWSQTATAADSLSVFDIKNLPITSTNPLVSNITFEFAHAAALKDADFTTVFQIGSTGIVNVPTGGGYDLNGSNLINSTTIASSVTSASGLTTVGTIGTGTWQGSLVALAYGGTNANLTASNGGIFYSTASAGAILAGTATAKQLLMSGASTTPIWSTTTYPSTDVAGGLHYVSSTNTISDLAIGSTGQVLTVVSGAPAWAAAPSGGLTVSAITADQTAAVGFMYVDNKSGSQLALTMPTTAAVGSRIEVIGGSNSAGVKFVGVSGLTFHSDATTGTTGTGAYISTANQYGAITIVCLVANTDWEIESSTGSWTLN